MDKNLFHNSGIQEEYFLDSLCYLGVYDSVDDSLCVVNSMLLESILLSLYCPSSFSYLFVRGFVPFASLVARFALFASYLAYILATSRKT